MMPKFFIGPMSKNIVDAVVEYTNDTGVNVGLIPSRRQVEFSGGYVNNWKTRDFAEYVRSKTQNVMLVRDHAGPMQGNDPDDGTESLKFDILHFDLIHIDPWKKAQTYEEGLKDTISLINMCESTNDFSRKNISYEVATEESIRKFTPEELKRFISDLEKSLTCSAFKRIKYLVVQSGTALEENHNTGEYDKDRLLKMVDVARSFGKISKEHNGDYLENKLVKEKFDIGLDSINIAPEFGQIQTKVYIQKIEEQCPDAMEDFFNICLESGRWKKWVKKDFKPRENKVELINICGHYVFSNKNFLEKVHSRVFGVELDVKNKITERLIELNEHTT